MKTNKKTREQKALRQQMIDYLEEQRAKELLSDTWTPGRTSDYRVAKMAKAKIGSASYETKGAKKWRKCKEHLSNRNQRHQPIDMENLEI